MELNRERNEVAYALGRAFSLYERIQSIANGGNSNIAVRYINSACTTPAVVFPVLARLSEAHLAKIGKTSLVLPSFFAKTSVESWILSKRIQYGWA